MDTRKITKEYRLSHWAGIMRERKASEMSIKAYCESAGIYPNVYYYWQRKLREAACQELLVPEGKAENTAIVPSGWAVCETAPESSSSITKSIVIEIGKSRITATAQTDPDLLTRVCRILMSIC